MKRRTVDVDIRELDTIVESTRDKYLDDTEREKLKTAIHALAEQFSGFKTTEKADKVVEPSKREPKEIPIKPKAPGHGRKGHDQYKNAKNIFVPNNAVHRGQACPCCTKGKVYPRKKHKVLVRLVGQAPIQATKYSLESLRCNLCGEIFNAAPPEDVGTEKFDETVASMVALSHYGSGFPFYRMSKFLEHLGVPLPPSNQWDLVEEAAELIKPAYHELIRQAAQGQVLHNDDTSIQILQHKRSEDFADRTGIFTTGIVSISDSFQIALFHTGEKHAGENLGDVLSHRAEELPPPIHMCDGLSRNNPKSPKLSESIQVVLTNCLVHGRRNFVDVIGSFPDQCCHVLDLLGKVFLNDRHTRVEKMHDKERLQYHQTHSGPVMDELHSWLNRQIDEKLTEPNSGLGKAINYLRKRWHQMTVFLRNAGAPIENNIVERALKKAIMHRNNSLFYKTNNGAEVGDLFMSIIHTCELNKVNVFDYLTELQRHHEKVRSAPASWMPWNFHEQIRGPKPDTG
jgi:transposase